MRQAHFSMLFVVVVAGSLIGCGRSDRPTFYNVQGQVTLDGEPLPEATLTFQRISGDQMEFARPSICVSGSDGMFEPWTMQEGDGLPAGRYQVGVMAQKQVGGPAIRPDMTDAEYNRIKWESIIPDRYLDAASSGIEIEVTADGMQPNLIELASE